MPVNFKPHASSFTNAPIYFRPAQRTHGACDDNVPAIRVMHDFAYEAPLQIKGDVHVNVADALMGVVATRDFLVSSAEGVIIGIVSQQHLHSDKLVQMAHDMKMSFDELEVSDVMTPLSEMARMTLRDAFQVTIGAMRREMSESDAPYILIVSNSDPESLVGLFSRERLRQEWQLDLNGSGRAQSFAALEKRLLEKHPH